MRRSTEIRQRSNARSWKIRQDHDRIARELENSKQDEKELETFIQNKQEELENWRAEEQEVSRKLEALRLEASTAQQKKASQQRLWAV